MKLDCTSPFKSYRADGVNIYYGVSKNHIVASRVRDVATGPAPLICPCGISGLQCHSAVNVLVICNSMLVFCNDSVFSLLLNSLEEFSNRFQYWQSVAKSLIYSNLWRCGPYTILVSMWSFSNLGVVFVLRSGSRAFGGLQLTGRCQAKSSLLIFFKGSRFRLCSEFLQKSVLSDQM